MFVGINKFEVIIQDPNDQSLFIQEVHEKPIDALNKNNVYENDQLVVGNEDSDEELQLGKQEEEAKVQD